MWTVEVEEVEKEEYVETAAKDGLAEGEVEKAGEVKRVDEDEMDEEKGVEKEEERRR